MCLYTIRMIDKHQIILKIIIKFLFLAYLKQYLFSFIYYYHHREKEMITYYIKIVYDI